MVNELTPINVIDSLEPLYKGKDSFFRTLKPAFVRRSVMACSFSKSSSPRTATFAKGLWMFESNFEASLLRADEIVPF